MKQQLRDDAFHKIKKSTANIMNMIHSIVDNMTIYKLVSNPYNNVYVCF